MSEKKDTPVDESGEWLSEEIEDALKEQFMIPHRIAKKPAKEDTQKSLKLVVTK